MLLAERILPRNNVEACLGAFDGLLDLNVKCLSLIKWLSDHHDGTAVDMETKENHHIAGYGFLFFGGHAREVLHLSFLG
jgi:hypothetical protein